MKRDAILISQKEDGSGLFQVSEIRPKQATPGFVKILVGCGAIALGVCIATCLGLAFGPFTFLRIKEVPPAALLLADPGFPATWQVGEETAQVNWQPAETANERHPEAPYAAQQSASRVWTDNGQERAAANVWITQRVFQYKTSLEAIAWYYRNYPERVYGQQWPNFTFPENAKYRYPQAWDSRTTAAQEHVACAMGGFSRCQLWYYRARYGQYVLEIEFFALNRGLDEALFEEIARAVDAHIASVLEP
ncbi:MAG: hypothetical protein ACOYYS_26600 [Chloroflexota bacterium]